MSGMLLQSASPVTLPSLLYEVHVFNEKKEQYLVHARVMKALPQSRGGGGIIITIKTIEAAEMSCLLQSMVNSLARGRAA